MQPENGLKKLEALLKLRPEIEITILRKGQGHIVERGYVP